MEIHHCFENPCLKSLCLSSPLFGKYFLFIIFLFLQSKSDPDWEKKVQTQEDMSYLEIGK